MCHITKSVWIIINIVQHQLISETVFHFALVLSQLVVWVDPLDGTKEYTEGKLA